MSDKAPQVAPALVGKKVIGLAIGSLLGVVVGVAVGPGTCPPWRQGVVFGWNVDTERVALGLLLGALIGVGLPGGTVGRIGWATITGTAIGILVGAEFLPYYPLLGLTGRHIGAMAGGLCGVIAGGIWGIVHRRRVWALSVAVFLAGLYCWTIYQEHKVAEKVYQLGGQVQQELGFVRFVSVDNLNEAQLTSLAKDLEKLSCLHSLALGDSELTDDGLKALGGLNTLAWLYAAGDRISDGSVEHLRGLTNLQYLSVPGTALSDQGMAELKAALPRLEEIRLR